MPVETGGAFGVQNGAFEPRIPSFDPIWQEVLAVLATVFPVWHCGRQVGTEGL